MYVYANGHLYGVSLFEIIQYARCAWSVLANYFQDQMAPNFRKSKGKLARVDNDVQEINLVESRSPKKTKFSLV